MIIFWLYWVKSSGSLKCHTFLFTFQLYARKVEVTYMYKVGQDYMRAKISKVIRMSLEAETELLTGIYYVDMVFH